MLVRQWINSAQDGITTKVIPENIVEVVLACNNICLTIPVPPDKLGFSTMSLQHLLIKLTIRST